MTAFKITRLDCMPPRELSVAQAVERTLDDTFDEGELESMRRRLSNHEEFLGKLVEHLAESGHISLEFLRETLSYNMKVELA